MKKSVLFVLAAIAAFVAPMSGQTAQNQQPDTIIVRKSDLPPEVLKNLESQKELAQMAQKIETYGKWVGLGKEVGVAVNDSLAALTDQSERFGKTNVGKFTMFIVAYKVLGKDAVGVVIGVPLLVVFLVIWVWSYRRTCIQRTILVKSTKDDKVYERINEDGSARAGYAFVHLVALIGIGALIVGTVIF